MTIPGRRCITVVRKACAGIFDDIAFDRFSKNMLTAKHWLFHTRHQDSGIFRSARTCDKSHTADGTCAFLARGEARKKKRPEFQEILLALGVHYVV
jgi:hypothetical protein